MSTRKTFCGVKSNNKMVKLEITIKELTSIDLEKATAIGTEIAIKEIGKNASKNEKAVSNILKKRLKK